MDRDGRAQTGDATFDATLPGLRCDHCGMSVTFNLPLPLLVSIALIRSFTALHQFCAMQKVFKTEEPTP